jgi:RNA polymerase sigma-70 factor, ECF subfamily
MLVDSNMVARYAIPNNMTNDDNDLGLARRLADGEDAAMQELCAAYGQRLYAYALRITSDPHQAEDVVQDTLVIAWKKARTFRGDGRLLAWLLGIVHHTAIKSLRHPFYPITDEVEQRLEARTASPEDQVDRSEQTARINLGMRSLSPEHRAVLELIFYQGLSLEEAARVCAVPLGTVKSRLSYARRSLRGVLTRQDVEDAG